MPRPSLIIRWIRVAWTVASSSVKPEVSIAVSKSSETRSLTDLSFLSAETFSLIVLMIEWSGLISRCFLADM